MTIGNLAPTSGTVVDERPAKPQYYTVMDSLTQNRVHFRSVSEKRARAWVEAHMPRGSDHYLQYPNGETWAYEQERTGERGADLDPWQPFDPSTYVRPEQGGLLAPDEWADAEV